MKKLLPVVVAVAFLCIGAFLQRAAAETIAYDSLPVGDSAQASSVGAPPSAIGSNESVPGLFVAAPPASQRKVNEPRGYWYASIFGTEAEARAFSATGRTAASSSSSAPQQRVCIGQNRDSVSDVWMRLVHYAPPPPSSSAKAPRPPPVASAKKVVRPAVKRSPVRFVRMEKLTVVGDKATLDAIDAWVDVQTLGARLIAKTSSPMKRITSAPNGLDVFAVREAKTMHVVVRAPPVPLDGVEEKFRTRWRDELEPVAAHVGVQTATSGGIDASDCGHYRFTLEYEGGTGQMATIVTTAILKGGVEEEVDETKSKDDDEEDASRPLAVRTRLLLGSVSLTQASSEKEPILSVSWGWGGKTQILRF